MVENVKMLTMLATRWTVRAGLAALATAVLASAALGQGTGEFLCSAGNRDGLACESDLDCPGGVCVIAQGVCDGGTDDGLTCDCPAGTCLEAPVCSIDPSFGTCSGGTSDGFCCDVTFNCSDGSPCVGSAQICAGGVFAGFACLRDEHCDDSVCASSGRYCIGGDFESYSCNLDADCPDGTCTGVALPTATPTTPAVTPVTPVATPTAPPTATTGPGETPVATATQVPTSTARSTSTPLPTRTATQDTRPGVPAVVAAAAPSGTARLFLEEVTPDMPVEGVVLVGDESIAFTRRITGSLSNRLDLREELESAVAAGTVVRLVAFTPTPGGSQQEIRAEGDAACTVRPDGQGSALPLLLLAVLFPLARPAKRRD